MTDAELKRAWRACASDVKAAFYNSFKGYCFYRRGDYDSAFAEFAKKGWKPV